MRSTELQDKEEIKNRIGIASFFFHPRHKQKSNTQQSRRRGEKKGENTWSKSQVEIVISCVNQQDSGPIEERANA